MFGKDKKTSDDGRVIVSVSMNEDEYRTFLQFKDRISVLGEDLISDSTTVKIAISVANQFMDKVKNRGL